jgi:hypothetical protein
MVDESAGEVHFNDIIGTQDPKTWDLKKGQMIRKFIAW